MDMIFCLGILISIVPYKAAGTTPYVNIQTLITNSDVTILCTVLNSTTTDTVGYIKLKKSLSSVFTEIVKIETKQGTIPSKNDLKITWADNEKWKDKCSVADSVLYPAPNAELKLRIKKDKQTCPDINGIWKCEGLVETDSYVSEENIDVKDILHAWDMQCVLVILFGVFSSSPAVIYEYVGCVLDSDVRTVPYEKIYSDFQTNKRCATYCCAMSNYTYSGTEVGWECYCGNDSSRFEQYPDTDCNVGCFGDNSEMCGGHWRLSVYKLECPNTKQADGNDVQQTSSVKNGGVIFNTQTTRIPIANTEPQKMTLDEVLDRIAEIQREIVIDVKQTTAYKNSKVSAPDDRMSSKSIGIFGLMLVLFPMLVLTISDIFSCFTKSPTKTKRTTTIKKKNHRRSNC